MSRLTWDRIAEPVSRYQILRRERGQGNFYFPCSAHHVQDLQPYPVDPYSAIINMFVMIIDTGTYRYTVRTYKLLIVRVFFCI